MAYETRYPNPANPYDLRLFTAIEAIVGVVIESSAAHLQHPDSKPHERVLAFGFESCF